MGSTSKISDVVAVVKSGNRRGGNKRDAEEEIQKKLNAENRDWTYNSHRPAKRKTLIANNLPFSVDKSHVIDFFKQAGDIIDNLQIYTDKSEVGEIVDVRFSYDKDGNFNRSGLIEFSTEEAAKKAVNLNGQNLLGCQVARRQAEGTPGASKTSCVKNLPFYTDKSDVINFFREAGHIADVRFLYDHEDGSFRRIGYVEFATEEAAKEALKLDGGNLCGRLVRLFVKLFISKVLILLVESMRSRGP
ncbi:hypothetical protein MKX01_013383 [Papaver californicum]|nr:hypothetical protein MKX01_013383 [Papaver californicum]